MKFLNPNKERINKLLSFLYNQILSDGGDGDALWLTKLHALEDIKKLVIEYNNTLEFKWVIMDGVSDKYFSWGENQEWVIITDDKEYYDESPEWITMKIKY
jgi:hypothetical protein